MAEEHSQQEPELRLVLLGRTGAGQGSAGDAILGRPAFQPEPDAGAAARCQKHRGLVGGRQVVVVMVPDWFSSRSAPPEEARALVSSFVALSSPGPHAFLLCVPTDRPSDGEERALAALELILGPSAVTDHTLVLFTRGEEKEEEEEMVEQKEVQTLEELLSTRRRDLLELVDTCGGRYHALRGGGGAGGAEVEEMEEKQRRRSVQELLKKLQQAVGESEQDFFTCALYEEAGERVRARQEQLARERRERSGRGGEEEEPEDDDAEGGELEEREREEAERGVGDLGVDVAGIFASMPVCAASPPPSLLWGLWERLLGWVRRVPKLVRLEALFGSLVGLFVGGPIGRMLGATAGSVATEVGRRNKQKTK